MHDVEEKLTGFLEKNFLFTFGEEIHGDVNLFDAGILDSFGYIQLIKFIEKEFQVPIQDEDLTSQALNSLKSMTSFVKSRSHADTRS